MCSARVSTKHVKSINIGIEKLFQTVPTTLYPINRELSRYNFFFLQMDSLLLLSSRNYTTKIRNIIFYVPPLSSSSPISTFLIRNSFIARPSGERLALVLYVVWCVLIKNFRLSELPSSLSLHVCSLSLRFLSPLFVKLRGGDIYKSVI